MSAEVKILLEGYTSADYAAQNDRERTQPTITLVRDSNIVMVVDPGIMENPQDLVDALAKEGLKSEDVNFVCITHSHIDHYRNIGMFPNAKILEYYGLWHKGSVEDWKRNFSPNINILHTPGHDYSGISLFVTTKDGVVAVCGDIFWKENYPSLAHDDAFASNANRLAESRNMVLKKSDWVIPGHGPMFKSNKAEISEEEKKSLSKGPKITIVCKKCGRKMEQKDKCQCRPYLCYDCCGCETDCNLCSCSHRRP